MTDQSVNVTASTMRSVSSMRIPNVSVRSYFSSHYLYTAQMFSAEAGRIEQAGSSRLFDPRHRGFVIGSITMSCSFLEAMINEVFQDIADGSEAGGYSDYVAPIPDEAKRMLSWLWKFGRGDWLRVLEKLDAVQAAAATEKVDTGRSPYQDVVLVIQIRNALMHYKPQSLGGDVVHDLTKKLRGVKFPLNPLVSSGNPYFPDHVLGHGCAEWAWKSCKTLADEFSARLGIFPNYQRAKFETPTEGLA